MRRPCSTFALVLVGCAAPVDDLPVAPGPEVARCAVELPSVLDFETVAVGESAERVLSVSSPFDRPCELPVASVEPGEFELRAAWGARLDPGASANLRVAFTPAEEGARSA